MFVRTDLHGHTFHSDGRATPGGFVQDRKRAGLALIAISDHDVFTASRSGHELATGLGMGFLAAAELTSVLHFGTDRAEQIHVLAYYPPDVFEPGRLESKFFYQRGLRVRARWREFVLEWIDGLPAFERSLLSRFGTFSRVPATEFPALQTFLDMIARLTPQLADPFRAHHVRFWLDDSELFGWAPEELIDAIRADGALDFVAHSVRYRDRARTRKLIEYAAGVEVFTSRHGPKYTQELLELAESLGKHWTASTDDHQNGASSTGSGQAYAAPASGTPRRTVEAILGHPIPDAWARP
ncbi:MAG: hypothetical protein HYV07_00500 [Deltaproteobacteria bacterium]|nr:hypothetical protein [Deltaproteobacteria bacterium]